MIFHGMFFRWIGASKDNEEIYRKYKSRIDFLFDGLSMIPSIVVSYYWGLYLVVFIFETLTSYSPSNTAIGATVVMTTLLIIMNWKLRKIRHTMLDEDVFSKTQKVPDSKQL
jgi:hypothetical protein